MEIDERITMLNIKHFKCLYEHIDALDALRSGAEVGRKEFDESSNKAREAMKAIVDNEEMKMDQGTYIEESSISRMGL